MRVARPLLVLFALAIAVGGCARQPVMRVQMAAAPAPSYGIDNVVYGGGPAGYANPVAPSPYQPAPAYAAAPTYAPQAMPAYGMATTPTYAAVTGQTYTAPAYAAPAYTTAAASAYGGYPGAAATAYAAPAAYAAPRSKLPTRSIPATACASWCSARMG
jgi:hypothetical protein